VGTLRCGLHAGDLKFQPIAFFEMMNASIEGQEKFQCMLVGSGNIF
jgi:hypothetical protein